MYPCFLRRRACSPPASAGGLVVRPAASGRVLILRSLLCDFAFRPAVLVEKGPALLKALQNTRRDRQPALLRYPVRKPHHRAGWLSVVIAARTRVSRVRAGRTCLSLRAPVRSSLALPLCRCVLVEEPAAGAVIRL